MCGRVSLEGDSWDQIKIWAKLPADPKLKWTSRYNVAPGSRFPVIFERDGKLRAELFLWGLIPPWAKERSFGFKTSNARCETVLEKPTYRTPMKNRKRCFIPVDGFYEWKAIPDPSKPKKIVKQPYRMVPKDGPLLALAGLYDHAVIDGEELDSFTIITTTPSKFMSKIHDRMPVILQDEEARAAWLSPDTPIEDAVKLLKPAKETFLRAFEVSTLVNNSKIDGPELIEPL